MERVGQLRRTTAALLLLLSLAAACSKASAASAKHAVFVAAAVGRAAIVEWTNTNGALTQVSIKSVEVDPAVPNGIRETNATGSGSLAGNTARLTVNGAEVVGTVDRSHLTLTLPGGTEPVRLDLASAPKFDRALVLLKLEGGDAAKAATVAAGRAASQRAVTAAVALVTADHEALKVDVSAIDHPGVLGEHLDKMQAAAVTLPNLVSAVQTAALPGKCSAALPKAAVVDAQFKIVVDEAAAFAANVKSMSDGLVSLQQHEEKTIIDLRTLSQAQAFGIAAPEKPSPSEISRLLSDGDKYAALTKQALANTRPRVSTISANARTLQKRSEHLVKNCSPLAPAKKKK